MEIWDNKKMFYVDWLYEKEKVKLPINLKPTDNIIIRISGMKYEDFIESNPELKEDPAIFYEALEEAVKMVVKNTNDVFFGYTIASEISFVIKNTHGQTVENVDLLKIASRLNSMVSSVFNVYIDRIFTPKSPLLFKQSVFTVKNNMIITYLSYRNRFRTTIELNKLAIEGLPRDMINKEFVKNIQRLKRLNPDKYYKYMNNVRLRDGFSYSKNPDILNVKMPIYHNNKLTFTPLLTKRIARNLVIEFDETEDNVNEQELISMEDLK